MRQIILSIYLFYFILFFNAYDFPKEIIILVGRNVRG